MSDKTLNLKRLSEPFLEESVNCVPKIGDIAVASDVGRAGVKNRYMFVACAFCGKERWRYLFMARKGHNLGNPCLSCANKMHINNVGRFQTGYLHRNWKGGRFKQLGYVSVMINRDSKYSEMARSYGGTFLYVPEHRLVYAKSIGRPLSKKEHIHHLNGVKDDNRIENLALVSVHTHNTRSLIQQQQEKILQLEKVIKNYENR